MSPGDDEADDSDAKRELKRLRKEIEREKRRAKEVADNKSPDEVAAALLPDLEMKW
jgi:hypothetical protein